MFRNSLLVMVLCIAVVSLIWLGCAQKSPEELYTMATEAHQAGQINKALKNYQKIADKYPDSELAFKAAFMGSHLSSDTTQKEMAAADEAYQEYFFNEAQRIQQEASKEAELSSQNVEFEKAVNLYQKFLQEYPQSIHAYKAQFMIGFIYNETLQDTAKARQAFRKVLKDYPENDLTDDARWMMDNLDKGPEEIITGEDK